MKNVARTKEKFNQWFTEKNGDPWDYNSKGVKDRLNKTFNHIQKIIKQDFTGTIVELGVFNGDFTNYLVNHYKNAKIICNDISDIAIEKAQQKLTSYSNIDFIVCDFLSIPKYIDKNNIISRVVNKLFAAKILKNINKFQTLRYYFGGQTLFFMKRKVEDQ